MLFVARCSLNGYCLFLVVCYVLPVILCGVCCLVFAAWCLMFVVCSALFARFVCCLLFVE